jgi:hypothetical protein
MTTDVFLKPRLVGERFTNHSIPLEMLADLALLKDLILEVAKSQWISDHPDRQRTPKGFFDGHDLCLTAVDPGSAIPVIMLLLAQPTVVPLEPQQYMEKSRDAIIAAIAAADDPVRITALLPDQALSYFNRLGRGLLENEAIEFTTGIPNAPARLTRESRKKLVLASKAVQEYTEPCTLRGTIPEADQGKMTFTVQTRQGRRITSEITESLVRKVLDAFNAYRSGARVAITGIGRFNRAGVQQGFESIHDLVLLDPLDVPCRMDELRDLQNGWLDGHGIAPDSQGLDWLSEQFDTHYRDELPLPHCYPTETGDIRAEWSIRGWECSLEIDLKTHHGAWHAVHTNNAEEERTFDFSDLAAWKALNEHIASLNTGVA